MKIMTMVDHRTLREAITDVVGMIVEGKTIWINDNSYYKYDNVHREIVMWVGWDGSGGTAP